MSIFNKLFKKKDKRKFTVRTTIVIPNNYGYFKDVISESDYFDSYELAKMYQDSISEKYEQSFGPSFNNVEIHTGIYYFSLKEVREREKAFKRMKQLEDEMKKRGMNSYV